MLLRDPLVQVLALKLGKLASEQSGIALNIPPWPRILAVRKSTIVVTSRRWPTIVLRMGSGEFATSADSTAQFYPTLLTSAVRADFGIDDLPAGRYLGGAD